MPDAIRYEDFIVKNVEQYDDGKFLLEMTDARYGGTSGTVLDNPERLPLPKVGKPGAIGLMGGALVLSVVVDGVTYKNVTPEQHRVQAAAAQKNKDDMRRAEYEATGKAALSIKIKDLPASLQRRLERFMSQDPDWGWRFGCYEMFVCEEAAKIAAKLGTRKAIVEFGKLPHDEQSALIPDLSDGHSGNTFVASVYLAAVLADGDEDVVVKTHGALCPLVGCKVYGCWAATAKEPTDA